MTTTADTPRGRRLLTADEARDLLPDVLIDYLWGLALSGDWQGCESQSFVLNPLKLGKRSLQEIWQLGTRCHEPDLKRVYGIEPVHCRLGITLSEREGRMELLGS